MFYNNAFFIYFLTIHFILFYFYSFHFSIFFLFNRRHFQSLVGGEDLNWELKLYQYRLPSYIMMYYFSQNNRGRRAERDVWVFGIVTTEYTPCRGYFKVVKRRDAATLHPIIERCIRPGTEVHTDDWGAYRNLDRRLNNVATHRVVNHSRHFVDPRTGVHTQEAESCWATLKLKQIVRRGIRRKDMQSYLDDRMWRQWRGGPRQHVMRNFVHVLAGQFDNFTVF